MLLVVDLQSVCVCVDRGCHNITNFFKQVCFDYKPRIRTECKTSYDLHLPPKHGEGLFKTLNLKTPPLPNVSFFRWLRRVGHGERRGGVLLGEY